MDGCGLSHRPYNYLTPMRLYLSLPALLLSMLAAHAADLAGWTEKSPRDEIRPSFSREAQSLVITQDARQGLDGWYQQTFTVQGGDFMKFSAARKTAGVEDPRHSGLALGRCARDAAHKARCPPAEWPNATSRPSASW